MRLLDVDTLEFAQFGEVNRPKYVIASHRWASSQTTLNDVRTRHNTGSDGYKKVEAYAKYIRRNIPSVGWLWIDTCCINKDNAAELSEAINLMFKWYRNAEGCLAYLGEIEATHDRSFGSSEWLARGRTLQELIAPRIVVLVTKTWQVIGHKGGPFVKGGKFVTGPNLEAELSSIAGIRERVLVASSTGLKLSDDEKLSWMERRLTTREEDDPYALYGIFGVTPGANYGERCGEGAKRRLLTAIRMKYDVATNRFQSITE